MKILRRKKEEKRINFCDLHSHYLYGIDDGSKSIEESISLIKKAYEEGTTSIILTPHYIRNSKYNANNEVKLERFNKLKEELKKQNINVNLYLGNEVFISSQILRLIEENEIYTLNNSRYVLIEFGLSQILYEAKDIIFDLVRKGYIPVLAHPERYKIFQKDPERITNYIKLGVLLQCNYQSLFGNYGTKARKTAKYFLKKRYITFLGSDTHHDNKLNLDKLENKLLKIIKDQDYVDEIMNKNFNKVIKDIELGAKTWH